MINELKDIARELSLPIELYSEPQDDTINQDDLNAFYEKNGFELHPCDVDYSYYVWAASSAPLQAVMCVPKTIRRNQFVWLHRLPRVA